MSSWRRLLAGKPVWAKASAAAASAALLAPLGARTESDAEARRDGRPPRAMMYVRDPDAFAHKWKKFTTDGIDKLLVIADFDYTLTPFFKDGTDARADSSHGILLKSDALGPEVKAAGRATFAQYYPIEQSPSLSDAEKLPFIVEWWTKEHDILIKSELHKSAILAAVQASDVTFRPGFYDIFDVLTAHSVPTLIFSAGLYDVIHAVLDKEYAKRPSQCVPKNVHVVSNMMRFNKDGTAVGFDGKLIHSLNKNASVVLDTPFWAQCQMENRRNILLLGDSISDARMANGLDYAEDEIVRVGFLNHPVTDEKLQLYLQTFDVVLTHDSSLLPVELLLHQIQK